jgi:hypothetical protein
MPPDSIMHVSPHLALCSLLLLLLLLLIYRPENKKEKADRLKAEAAARESGKVCVG